MNSLRRQAPRAILLAAIAGFVDAVGYLVLHEIFVAHLTGDTDLLGQQLARGRLTGALPLVTAVGAFVGAIAVVTGGVEAASRRRWRSPTVAALVLEAVLVAAFMMVGHGVVARGGEAPRGTAGFYVLLALGAAAMGTQAATVVKAGSRTIRTTYMSGMMTRFAQNTVHALVGSNDATQPSYLRDQLGHGRRAESAQAAVVYLALWSAFLGGAVLGAFAERRFTLWALGFPLGAFVVAGLLDVKLGR